MKDSSKNFCSVLFDVLSENGLRTVVCSPGSRNVPLLLACASRTEIKKYFASDERSAAFLGLGMALVSRNPIALVCTSGTALLNYAPAVAEAYYQGLPLIVISADRPIQWIDQDDSQTLRQDDILRNFVKKSFSIPDSCDDNPELLWYVNRIVNEAFLEATSKKPGPVHINVHISEPLGKKIERTVIDTRIIQQLSGDAIGNKEIIKKLATEVSQSKVLLVCGFGLPDSRLQKCVTAFSKLPNVAVMAETISNLHLNFDDYSVDSVLTTLDPVQKNELKPDLVISIGGALVSRKLKEFLREQSKEIKHWALGFSNTFSDPFTSLTLRIETDPARFLRNITATIRNKTVKEVSDYSYYWEKARENALKKKQEFIDSCPWSELKAFEIVLKSIPSNFNLFLSNGTPVRYAQIIPHSLPHSSYCNRGVSGIDGNLSTAIGGSISYNGPTILLTGDLSLTYDIGALGLRDVPSNFKVIVINNQGGGIFRFIPSTCNLEEREQYLCQPPFLPTKKLAEAYEWDFVECSSEEELQKTLPSFFSANKKTIMQINCDGEESAKILKNYMKIK